MNPILINLLAVCAAVPAFAQLAPPNSDGVAMGHVHLNVDDLSAQQHFWVDILGAKPMKLGTIDGVRVPGMIVLFKLQAPTGATVESVMNHLGLKVRDLAMYPPLLNAAKIPFDANKNGQQLMVTGPEGLRLELTEDKTMQVPVANHHIHLATTDVPAMQAWYAKTFGAIPGKRSTFEAADLPGVNLSFTPVQKPPLPTKGRVVDHIGFEVRNLQAFCQKLEAEGVKFDVPYRKVASLGISLAFLTDPWGTYIELTEGLDKL